ncbi:hypothetical protein [Melittangium boletus]|uniref:SH3b domain-containing protein n=1 Tax=Melittangium boletus DSM 14713 TaxID=1294270 RepID=A0A250ISX0_9BACT|nr:hypothetical protein [Melittangium boletus]ATB34342.1 hypothetical protein MEBOL_007843 [Melittangium boletus DSM 14713]
MNRERLAALLALTGVSLAGAALAQKPSVLYVKAKNTHLKDSSKPSATTLAILQPGHTVSYLGREGTTPWHQVTAVTPKGSLQGVIYQANLSASPPALEVTSESPDKPLSPEAFASSGAAIKALGQGAIAYGKSLPLPQSVDQLSKLEDLAKDVEDAQVAAYAQAGGLPAVVGTSKIAKASTVKSTSKKGAKR